jgi:hypothetical protein
MYFLYLGFYLKSEIFFILNDYIYIRFPESPQGHTIMTDQYFYEHLSQVFNI